MLQTLEIISYQYFNGKPENVESEFLQSFVCDCEIGVVG